MPRRAAAGGLGDVRFCRVAGSAANLNIYQQAQQSQNSVTLFLETLLSDYSARNKITLFSMMGRFWAKCLTSFNRMLNIMSVIGRNPRARERPQTTQEQAGIPQFVNAQIRHPPTGPRVSLIGIRPPLRGLCIRDFSPLSHICRTDQIADARAIPGPSLWRRICLSGNRNSECLRGSGSMWLRGQSRS